MDIAMPGLNGLETAGRMAKDCPAARVIILSMHQNEEYVWRALKSGAAGYLLKKAATAELATALDRVVTGKSISARKSPPDFRRVSALNGIANRKGPLEQLTGRQREILQLIAEGQNTKGIAEILKLSPKTVEYHRMKLMDCLKVHDVPGLVRFALRVGLIPQEG